MDMNYGCDVSNRYMGYLDSSDHENTMSSSNDKNKRKVRRKRKPKNQRQTEKNINTQANVLIENVEATVDMAENIDNEESCADEEKQVVNDAIHHENDENSMDDPKNGLSCETPVQSDTLEDAVKINNGNPPTEAPENTKWSEICLEEEKRWLAVTESAEPNQKIDKPKPEATFEPESVANRRVYPTMYFYNSNFGNKHCRSFVFPDESNRRVVIDNDNHNNRIANEKKQNYRNQYGKNRKKHIAKPIDDTDQADLIESHSGEESHTGSQNVSNGHVSQQSNESNSYREYINSKNRYNKFNTNGIPDRTFNRRRRPDYVRNV